MKKIYLLFLVLVNISFSEIYISKNKTEEDLLNDIRKEKITFGLSNNKYYTTKLDNGLSINDIVKDLLGNYLKLNINFIEQPFNTNLMELKNKKIDGIGFANRDDKRENIFDFTKTIFNEEIYVVSNTKKVNSLEDIENENIFIEKGAIYGKFFEAVLENNDLKANLIETSKLELNNNLIITPIPVMFNPKYGIKVSNASGEALAFSNKYDKLIPIVDNALNEKYREKINSQILKRILGLAYENFNNSLNEEEKEYLKKLKKIRVIYENDVDSILSYKLQKDSIYKGIAPNLLNRLGELLNLEIIDLTSLNTENKIESLKNNEVDALLLSKTKERSKHLRFTNKIDDIGLYVVSLKNSNIDNRTVGVVKNSVEESVAYRYDTKKNIRLYSSYKELLFALNENEIGNILTTQKDFDSNIYTSRFFEEIPINFALCKNNKNLEEILNKGMKYLINKDMIIGKSILEKESIDIFTKNKTKQNTIFFIIISLVLFITLIMSIIKVILDYKHKKELLKDPLSGLPNRSVFNEFCLNKGNNVEGYIFIIDFDNFKYMNDKYGHEFGDSIIVEFSNFLKNKLGQNYIFRISGDEFYGVLFNEIKDILEIFSKYKDECELLKKYDISISLGLYKKMKSKNINLAFKYADLALFEAKKMNGFSYKIADEVFICQKEKEMEILELLRGDLKEIYPVYQPKINLKDNKIIGAESLARCYCEKLGNLYPNEFIGIAEEYDLIHRIDYRIAEQTMKLLKEWIENNKISDDFRLSFNISVKTFSREDLVAQIRYLMEKYNISGEYLEIEITESILVRDMKDIINKLNALISLGIQISLDDFTAGHSTAGLLPILPISVIKFDKSLLDSLETNGTKGMIVYMKLASLIEGLKMKIVSEGIETEKQLAFLKSLGIDYGQGYLIGKPTVQNKNSFLKIEEFMS